MIGSDSIRFAVTRESSYGKRRPSYRLSFPDAEPIEEPRLTAVAFRSEVEDFGT